MNCLICHQKIMCDELIFWGNQMTYCGPGDDDCNYSADLEGLMGGMHLACLENLIEFNMTIPKSIMDENELVVERSDALDLFDNIN